MPSLCVVVVVLVEIVRSDQGRLGQSFATLGSRKLFFVYKVRSPVLLEIVHHRVNIFPDSVATVMADND